MKVTLARVPGPDVVGLGGEVKKNVAPVRDMVPAVLLMVKGGMNMALRCLSLVMRSPLTTPPPI